MTDPASPSGAPEAPKSARRKKADPVGPPAPEGDLFAAAEGAEAQINEFLGSEVLPPDTPAIVTPASASRGEMAGTWPALPASAAPVTPVRANPSSAAPAPKATARPSGVASWTMAVAIVAIVVSAVAIDRAGRITAVAAKTAALEQKLAAKADTVNMQEALAHLDVELRKDRLAVVALEDRLATLERKLGELEAKLVGWCTDLEVELTDLRKELNGVVEFVSAQQRDLAAQHTALEAKLAVLESTKSTPAATPALATVPAPQATKPETSPDDDYYGEDEEESPSSPPARPTPAADYYGP